MEEWSSAFENGVDDDGNGSHFVLYEEQVEDLGCKLELGRVDLHVVVHLS